MKAFSLVWFKSGSQTVGEFKIKDEILVRYHYQHYQQRQDAHEAEGAFYLRKTNTDKEGLAGVELKYSKQSRWF